MYQSLIFLLLSFGHYLYLVDSVEFSRHPVPIPSSPPSSSSYSSSSSQQGIQFLISNEDDGSYHFGYDTGGSPKSYREEIRDASGRIYGRYGYIDPEGFLRITEYVADDDGFRSTESKRLIFDNSDLQLIGPIPKSSSQYKYR